MGKKQSAIKSSGKAAQRAEASSRQDVSAVEETEEEISPFWTMTMLLERGYNLAKASQTFLSKMVNLNWQLLVQPRRFYFEPLVREFYAYIQDAQGVKLFLTL